MINFHSRTPNPVHVALAGDLTPSEPLNPKPIITSQLRRLRGDDIGKLRFESIGDRHTDLLRDVFRLSVVWNSFVAAVAVAMNIWL